jgi:diguanylate cyclase (GGDEF)-like protein
MSQDPEAPGVDAEEQPAAAAAAEDHDATLISSVVEFADVDRRVATLVVVQGAEIGRHYPLRRNRVVLGRGDAADVLVPHKSISRAHAQIEALRLGGDTIYRLTDLGSTNHVFVNGRRVESQVLADGDKIHLGGDVVLKFELQDAIDAKFHADVRNRIHYDDLTGLLTYESFQTAFSWELDRGSRSAKGCGVVMMDLDDFKRVNDTNGHLAGSAVLREVGALIRDRMRQFDVAARYGGEEFVAYLPETAAVEAFTAADRLRRLLAETTFAYQDRPIPMTISMGVSHFPEDGRALEPLIRVADERLYRAKRAGKNQVVGS